MNYGSYTDPSQQNSDQDVTHGDSVGHGLTSASAPSASSVTPTDVVDDLQQSKADNKSSEEADKSKKRKATPSEPGQYFIICGFFLLMISYLKGAAHLICAVAF